MSSKKLKKKTLRVQIAKSLAANFENLKTGISQKRFERNIRKASKALLSGVKTISEEKKEVKKAKNVKIELPAAVPASN